MSGRKVVRVLVMIDYGPDDPASGEVFDLTALAVEMLPQASYRANLKVEVEAEKINSWSRDESLPKHECKVSFSGDAGNWIYGAQHLDDVVNGALPDGDRVKAIKAKQKRCENKARDLAYDAMRAKLEQVAAIRHQHPIARVTLSPDNQLTGGAS